MRCPRFQTPGSHLTSGSFLCGVKENVFIVWLSYKQERMVEVTVDPNVGSQVKGFNTNLSVLPKNLMESLNPFANGLL